MKKRIYVEEDRVLIPAVKWLRQNWNYDEFFEDSGATGARIDSIGLMEARTFLIEAKFSVYKGMSWFQTDKGGIESKISNTLKDLYNGNGDQVSECIRSIWDDQKPPIVVVLAAKYSGAGLAELLEMLHVRSRHWKFDFRIWQWTGEAVEEIKRFENDTGWEKSGYTNLSIPRQTIKSNRPGPLTVEAFRYAAARSGVSHLLDHILKLAKTLGLRVQRTRSSLVFRRRTGGRWISSVAVYPLDSDTKLGLNVGMELWIAESFDELPGLNAPVTGHFTNNRYIDDTEDLNRLIEVVSSETDGQ